MQQMSSKKISKKWGGIAAPPQAGWHDSCLASVVPS